MAALLKAAKAGRISSKPAIVIANRQAPGLAIAKKMGIETAIVSSKGFEGRRAEYDQMLEDVLRKHGVTPRHGLVCLAGFMRILGPKIVSRYKNHIINIHPALLPAFRGLDAQRQALESGVKVTGCTVHYVDAGVDTGRIIVQRTVKVEDGDTVKSLSVRILNQEHKAYVEAVKIIESKKPKPVRKKTLRT